MQFNSVQFLFFFPIVVILYYVIPSRFQRFWLLFASYFFYMCWNAKYALLLLAATAVTYAGALLIEKTDGKKRKATLFISLALNVGMLGVFKYLDFFIDTLNRLLAAIHIGIRYEEFDILLPVGISFFVFQAMGYVIDVYRGDTEVEHSFIDYALFVSFFPQLVAGPIERSSALLGQLKTGHSMDFENFRRGAVMMLYGLFAKIAVADRCAQWVITVYSDYMSYDSYRVLIATFAFTIQIYCDFMGYSMIAKGAARILGIELMDNFAQPYFAVSIKDFWRKWHISLSTWFRDYVYIPLGGSRCSRIKKYRNLMITFLLSGLWHGASFTFVIWGGLHGLYLVIEDLLHVPMRGEGLSGVRKALAHIRTFLLVDIAFVFFRANSGTMALEILGKCLRFGEWQTIPRWGVIDMGLSVKDIILMCIGIAILCIIGFIREKRGSATEWLYEKPIVIRYAMYWTLMIFIIFSLDINGTEFIYFQF